MNAFDIAAVLAAVAAASGYINHRWLRLPTTTGTLAIALVSSIGLVIIDALFAPLQLADTVAAFLGRIDFNETLMHGMLSFLLFAGALHVDLEQLFEHKWTIALLATIGVLLSTAIVGAITWWTFGLVGSSIPVAAAVVFGALISPTDPIAVMGMLKELRAPRSLEAQIAGESLFNDGVAVVLFFGVLSATGLSNPGRAALDVGGLLVFFAREVAGGIALGLAFGYVGYRTLKSINEHSLELLITLALAMFMYSLSFRVHVSGPIAVVVAGLLIGNPGRKYAMSDRTREHIDAFWSMVDEILNAVLFLLIGLEVLAVAAPLRTVGMALLAIPITLLARLVSVSTSMAAVRGHQRFVDGIIPILTWSGVRGGISVAMALSLPPFPARDIVLACTYAVVVFSILVQASTMRRVLTHYRVGAPNQR